MTEEYFTIDARWSKCDGSSNSTLITHKKFVIGVYSDNVKKIYYDFFKSDKGSRGFWCDEYDNIIEEPDFVSDFPNLR